MSLHCALLLHAQAFSPRPVVPETGPGLPTRGSAAAAMIATVARSGLHVPAPRAVLSMAAPQEEMTEHEAFLKRMEQAGDDYRRYGYRAIYA